MYASARGSPAGLNGATGGQDMYVFPFIVLLVNFKYNLEMDDEGFSEEQFAELSAYMAI